MRLRLLSITLALLLIVGCAGAHADTIRNATNMAAATHDWPTKPVRIIEPFGAGGGPDLLARALAPKLSGLWGQAVTVENIPGAGATAGPAQVAKSPADGYTLLINTNAQAYSAAFLKDLPYDPLKGFIPIIPLTRQPYVLVAGKAAGVTTVAELIAAAKAKPGELKFGSTGIGTGTHIGVERFNQAAGIKALHVPPLPSDSNASPALRGPRIIALCSTPSKTKRRSARIDCIGMFWAPPNQILCCTTRRTSAFESKWNARAAARFSF